MPERVQLRRTRGWRMPPNTVKVDRSTPHGNPFLIQPEPDAAVLWPPEDRPKLPYAVVCRTPDARDFVVCVRRTREEALAEAIRLFRVEAVPQLDLTRLRGWNLACWCRPGDPCHADVLLEIANRPLVGVE